MHRSQVSLIIGDDKLYTDFVKPLSSEKKLMPLIVKLLGSYFYNDEVRRLVEGVSLDDLKEKPDFVSEERHELEEMLQDMRASVQFFGMCIADTNATLEEGMEMVSSFAKETGGSSFEGTEGQSSVPRLSVKNIEKKHNEMSQEKAKEAVIHDDPRIESLQRDMEQMKGSVGQILALLQGGAVSVSKNNASEVQTTEVRMDSEQTKPISSPISESVDDVVQEASVEEREAGKSMLKAMLQGGGIGGFS